MNKKLLGVLGVAALLLAGNFAWQEVKEVDAASGTTIYFKPNSNWSQANAKFDAWTWGGSSEGSWVDFTDSNGDGIYEALLATGRTGMKIVRRGPSQTSHSWDDGQKWNETGDLTIPTNGDNLWTQASEVWDGTGSWSEYVFVVPEYALMGTMTDWDTGTKMAENNGVYTLTLEDVPTGEQQFKLKSGGTWYGHSNFTVKGITVKNNADDNCVFTSEGGNYTFEYTTSTKTLNVTHVSYEELLVEELNALLTSYYNGGTYSKDTTINLNGDACKELCKLSELFHAGAGMLERVTYYNGNQLWMSRDLDNYSYYGTDEYGNLTYGVTPELIEPAKLSIAAKYETRNTNDKWHDKGNKGMEGYYITLKDIVAKTSHGWTKEGSVYSLELNESNNEVAEWFKAFTAPCYLGFNEKVQNYITFTNIEIEEKVNIETGNNSLQLRLIANGDVSKLQDGTNIFSLATIRKSVSL